MIEEIDPWAGFPYSNARRERLEELQRLFDILSVGNPGYSIEVTRESRSPKISAMVKRIGEAYAEQMAQYAIDTLLERNQ